MSVKPASANHPRMFYGWLVVAGAFTVTFVGFGCVCFAFDASGSYTLPIQASIAANVIAAAIIALSAERMTKYAQTDEPRRSA